MAFEMESNLMNGYRLAYDRAMADLQSKNPAEIERNADVRYDASTRIFHIPYIGTGHQVNLQDGSVMRLTPDGPVPAGTTVGVLILHYLLHAVKHPLSGRMISFREVRGVSGYFPTFSKRAILPLQGTFAGKEGALTAAGAALGGVPAPFGDTAVTLRIFPLVPVTYVLWHGDEEIPSSAAVLFDDSIQFFLPGEDIVLAASFGTYALMKHAKK